MFFIFFFRNSFVLKEILLKNLYLYFLYAKGGQKDIKEYLNKEECSILTTLVKLYKKRRYNR